MVKIVRQRQCSQCNLRRHRITPSDQRRGFSFSLKNVQINQNFINWTKPTERNSIDFDMAKNPYSIDALKTVLENELGKPLSETNFRMLKLAFRGHSGQFRNSIKKDQKIPYIVHPVGVAALIIKHFNSVKQYLKEDLETLISAALAHDLIEDTHITYDQIKEIGGEQVLRLVEAMTKLPNPNQTNREKRNQEITDRTLAAGSGAVYIRICDSMHNLSRPHNTPYKIMFKGVDRARNVYFPLLDKIKISDEFKKNYIERIEEADKYIKEHPDAVPVTNKTPQTINDAISTCAFFTNKKLLEVHDIVEIIQSITGADNVSTWSPYGKTEGFFKPSLSYGKEKRFAQGVKESQINFVAQELPVHKVKDFILNPDANGKYFILTLHISSTSRYLILISFETSFVPTWASITNMEFLIDFLSERLLVANGDYKRSLVAAASKLGMHFEIDWADHLAIEPANLLDLQKWQRRCAQAVRHVTHACETFFEQEADKSPLRDLVKVESRVKDTRSIMRKFLPPSHINWPRFEELPDIAGVRVICPTKKLVNNLKKYLSSTKVNTLGIRLHKYHQTKDYTKKPTLKGYRALHLFLAVDTYLNKKKIAVPCEVQLHTMVQDIWAKIAHRMTYKHDEASDVLRRQLRDISKSLENLDYLVDEVMK